MVQHFTNHPTPARQHADRFHVASEFEIQAALGVVDDKIAAVQSDISAQIDAVMRALLPDQLPVSFSLSGGETRGVLVGHGDMSIFAKITLVKIVPGAFPSSVSWRHDDMSGSFILDSGQTSVDVGLTQHGQKNIWLTNNDATVPAGIIVVQRRLI